MGEALLFTEPEGFYLSFYSNRTSRRPQGLYEPWERIAERLRHHDVREDKDGPAFAPHLIREGGSRQNSDVELITLAVLDFDDGIPFDEREHLFRGLEYVAYSSYSNSLDHPKYRVVLPLAHAVAVQDWLGCFKGLAQRFPGIDRTCKDPARLYYLPSCSASNQPHKWSRHGSGERLDVAELMALGRQCARLQAGGENNPTMGDSAPGGMIVDGEGRESSILKLAGALRAKGLDQEVIEFACHKHNTERLFPPLPDAVVNDRARRYAAQAALPDSQSGGQMDAPLDNLQRRFALICVGGTIGVIDMAGLRVKQGHSAFAALNVLKLEAGRLLMARMLECDHPGTDKKKCISAFMNDAGTCVYDAVAFTPSTTPSTTLNLWVGPTLCPSLGDAVQLKAFLLDVICAGDQELYDYLLKYLAHALQKPEEKPGVMITLIGGQGTGKGTFFTLIGKIWGATTLLTSRIADVVGDFNDSLEGSMWILLDEASFAGDRKAADALKSLGTSTTLRINPKGQPQRTISSVHRIVMATNHNHAATREHDDRRDLTLRVADKYKGDHAFWDRLYKALEYEAPFLMQELLAMELHGFNVRNKPNTRELTKQKLASLPPVEAFWYDALYKGGLDPLAADVWPTFIGTESLRQSVGEFMKGTRQYKPLTADALVATVSRICPGARRDQQTVYNRRVRGLVLPSLEDCRKSFENYIGGTIEW